MARLSVWMGDENELNTSAGAFSSRPSPRSFDMLGGALLSSGVVGCHRPLLVPRGFSCRVSPCLACFVPLVRSFLRRLRRICLLSVPLVSPYRRIARLPARSTREAGRWRLLMSVFIWFHAMLYASHSCYISRILVIYLAFLLYISHFCYMPGVFVIYLVFLLYQPVSCYTIL